MNKTKKGISVNKALMVGGALVSINALDVNKAEAVTGSGAMSAIILTPISISSTQALHFGTVAANATKTGDVVVTNAGVRTNPDGNLTLVTGAALENQGILKVTATAGVKVDVSFTATKFTVKDTATATKTMVVNALTFDAVGSKLTGANAFIIPTTATTKTTIAVGATLNLAAAQDPGTYKGTYKVSADYQ